MKIRLCLFEGTDLDRLTVCTNSLYYLVGIFFYNDKHCVRFEAFQEHKIMEVFLGSLDELQCNILETHCIPITGTPFSP